MPDKTYAKFILNNETYLDLTGDTVDSSSLLSGYTAHNRSGEPITGSFDTSIFVLKAGDTMSGSLTIANIEAEQLFEINSKNGLRLALDLSSLCNQGIWSSGYANSLTSDGAYIADSSWIIVRDSSNRVKVPKWASRGSSSSPVYFDEDGQPQQSSHSFSDYLLKTGGNVTFLSVSETGAAKGNSYNSQFTLGNSIDFTTTKGSCYGEIKLYSKRTGYALLNYMASSTNNVTLTLPNTTGTIALTSDLSSYVAKSGSIMTGALTLSGAPTENLHAATKKYVDDSVAGYLPLTGGTITGGYLIIDDTHLTSGSASAYLTLGNNVDSSSEGSSFGALNLYGTGIYKSSVRPTTLTDNRQLYLPDKDGTLAVIDDLNLYVLKTGDSLTGALSFYDGSTLKSKISNTELQINEHDLLRMTPHFAQMFATEIPANANLNTTTYLKCGQYYCTTTYGFVNSPTGNQFVMEVTTMIYNRYDDESGTAAAYRIRKITDYVGNQFIQYCSKPANGSWSYGAWKLYITGSKIGTLANASGTTLDESYCQQYGRTVNIRAWLTGLSTSTQTHTNVITVQSVDLPSTAVRFVFTCWLGNGIAAYAGYGVMDTSGRITLVKAVANSDKASFEFTYNV